MADPAARRHGKSGAQEKAAAAPGRCGDGRTGQKRGWRAAPAGSALTGAGQGPVPESRTEGSAASGSAAPGRAELDPLELAEGLVDRGQKMAKRVDEPMAMKHVWHDMVLRLRLR